MYRICYQGGLVDEFKDFESITQAVLEKLLWHNMFFDTHAKRYGSFFDLPIDYKGLAKCAYEQIKNKSELTTQTLNKMFANEGLSIKVEEVKNA